MDEYLSQLSQIAPRISKRLETLDPYQHSLAKHLVTTLWPKRSQFCFIFVRLANRLSKSDLEDFFRALDDGTLDLDSRSMSGVRNNRLVASVAQLQAQAARFETLSRYEIDVDQITKEEMIELLASQLIMSLNLESARHLLKARNVAGNRSNNPPSEDGGVITDVGRNSEPLKSLQPDELHSEVFKIANDYITMTKGQGVPIPIASVLLMMAFFDLVFKRIADMTTLIKIK